MRESKSAHIIVQGGGPSGGVKCLRCGATMIITLPCRVDDWCDAMRTFERRHRDCFDSKAES
jgi:hypothetical protein